MATNRYVQDQTEQYQGRGYPGMIADPIPPACYRTLKAGVPSNGDNIRTGMGVFYDQTNDDVRIPTSDAEELAVIGVASYDLRIQQTELTTKPSGANSPNVIEYPDDAIMRVAIEGHFFLTAGGDMEFGDALRYDRADKEWVKITAPTAIANIPRLSVVCLSLSAGNGDLFVARIRFNPVR